MPSWVAVARGKRARPAFMAHWRAVDRRERKNGVLYRRIVLALPEVLSVERKCALVLEFTEWVTTLPDGRLPYLFAIHSKQSSSPNMHANTHAHIMFSERINDGIERSEAGWFSLAARRGSGDVRGAKKAQIFVQGISWLVGLRDTFEQLANRYLEEDGHEPNVCMKSFANRKLAQVPTKHVGWGRHREARGELNNAIRDVNEQKKSLAEMYAQLEQMKLEEAISEAAIDCHPTDESQDYIEGSGLTDADLLKGADEDLTHEEEDTVEHCEAERTVAADEEESWCESEGLPLADTNFDFDDSDFVTDAS